MSIGIFGRFGGIYDGYHTGNGLRSAEQANRRATENVKTAETQPQSSTTEITAAKKEPENSSLSERSGSMTNASLEDIRLDFGEEADAGFAGMESDIRSSDVQKAISDMKKDRILEEYQYFVGSMREQVSEDGTVIQKQ